MTKMFSTQVIPAVSAWATLIIFSGLYYVFPGLYLAQQFSCILLICHGVLNAFVIINFALATFMDPGIIPPAVDEEKDDDFRSPLYKNVEIRGITVRRKWCTTCQFYRPPRCSHCSVCDNCIETFDHHCPWVNNCIGRRNYRHFFIFLISLTIHMLVVFGCSMWYIFHGKIGVEKFFLQPRTIITLAIIAIDLLLFIPVLGLTGFHVVLVARGRTTNEQVTGKFVGGYNPFSLGCRRNCALILCGPTMPRYAKYYDKSKVLRLISSSTQTASTDTNDVKVVVADQRNGAIKSLSSRCQASKHFSVQASETEISSTDRRSSIESKESRTDAKTNRIPGSYTNLFDIASETVLSNSVPGTPKSEDAVIFLSSPSSAVANHVPPRSRPLSNIRGKPQVTSEMLGQIDPRFTPPSTPDVNKTFSSSHGNLRKSPLELSNLNHVSASQPLDMIHGDAYEVNSDSTRSLQAKRVVTENGGYKSNPTYGIRPIRVTGANLTRAHKPVSVLNRNSGCVDSTPQRTESYKDAVNNKLEINYADASDSSSDEKVRSPCDELRPVLKLHHQRPLSFVKAMAVSDIGENKSEQMPKSILSGFSRTTPCEMWDDNTYEISV